MAEAAERAAAVSAAFEEVEARGLLSGSASERIESQRQLRRERLGERARDDQNGTRTLCLALDGDGLPSFLLGSRCLLPSIVRRDVERRGSLLLLLEWLRGLVVRVGHVRRRRRGVGDTSGGGLIRCRRRDLHHSRRRKDGREHAVNAFNGRLSASLRTTGRVMADEQREQKLTPRRRSCPVA